MPARPSRLAPGVCPVCHGAGYMALDVPIVDANFGRLIACDCKIRRRSRSATSPSWSACRTWRASRARHLKRFDRNIGGAAEAYEAALRYARNPTGWLVLMGNYGCGKTHLAAAIAIYATRHLALKTLFTIVPDLLDHLRATYHPTSAITYDERFEAVRTVPLLVLDDLGAESPTPVGARKALPDHQPPLQRATADGHHQQCRPGSHGRAHPIPLLHTAPQPPRLPQRGRLPAARRARAAGIERQRAGAATVGSARSTHRPPGARPGSAT